MKFPTLFLSLLRRRTIGNRFRFFSNPVKRFFLPILVFPTILYGQAVLPYNTGFEATEGFILGTLDGQDGWFVDQGDAAVTGNEEQMVVLYPAAPRTRISRDFTQFASENVVFVDFRIRGGAGEPPSNAPEASSPDLFHVALAAEGDFGRLYVFDGDGEGGGIWRSASALVPLDSAGNTLDWFSVTVRLDFSRKAFDVLIDEQFIGFNYGFFHNSQGSFSRFILSGNPNTALFVDGFYVGIANPLWENISGDGLPDSWKLAHGLALGNDQRDYDSDNDGLSNLEEFFVGTNPVERDTSRDGLLDGEAVALGVDPLASSNLFDVDLPFIDDFESWPMGNIHARGGWKVEGDGIALVSGDKVNEGTRALQLTAGEMGVAVQVDIAENQEGTIWTDFWIEVSVHTRPMPPSVSEEAAVAIYFDEMERAVAWDGISGSWKAFLPKSQSEKPGWVRLTVRQDFAEQKWSLWLNSVRVADNLGFASYRSSYKRFRVVQPEDSGFLDQVSVNSQEPAFLDNDGDGLINTEEIALGTDPENPDTSGDGMWDGDQMLWGMNPMEWKDFARLTEESEGRMAWTADFETGEGYILDFLDGQKGWNASEDAVISEFPVHAGEQAVQIPAVGENMDPGFIERFFGVGDEKEVWVTMHVLPQPGRLPDPIALDGPRSALVAVNSAGSLFAWDGATNQWINTRTRNTDSEQWSRIDIRLDYQTGTYWVCVDGVLILRDLGFRDSELRSFTRFGLQGATGESASSSSLDTLWVGVDEPPGLDFSDDGLTNDVKRALGLDVFAIDTNGDGLPDGWLVKHGLDALDPQIGNRETGYGITVREAFLAGLSPDISDTDGDGWADFEEQLAGTDFTDPTSAPEENGLDGWSVTQIGEGIIPFTFRVDDEYQILGSGLGAKGDQDSFTFAYRTITGNFEAIAKVRAPQNLAAVSGDASWLAQNGLMARVNLAEDSVYSAVFASPFWYWTRSRELTGQSAPSLTLQPLAMGEAYVRMIRAGNSFRHYLSEDGETWFLLSSTTVAMPEEVLLGMFASSNSEAHWIRGRISGVSVRELEDQGDWNSSGGEGGNAFDSFAWLGEWDGFSDINETASSTRAPTLVELGTAGLQVPTAFEILGAQAIRTVGEWEVQGTGIQSSGRRGWVEFELDVNQPDVYLIEIEGGEGNPRRQTASSFDLKIYLEEEYLGTRILEVEPGVSGSVYAFTPWLRPGTHRLRILWDGARSWTHLRVDAVRLRTIDGPDTSGDGVKDWVEARITRQSDLDPQPAVFTHVSPLPLEGRDRFNSLAYIQSEPRLNTPPGQLKKSERAFGTHPRGGVGFDIQTNRLPYAAMTSPISVSATPHLLTSHPVGWSAYLSAWSQPSRFAVSRSPGYRFRADVPLAPLVDNAITVSWQDGVAEERIMARWIPYNVLEGGNLVLRAGDSLLMTAHSGKQQSGAIHLNIGGEIFQTTPGSPLVYTFNGPGEYLVEGAYSRPNGQQFTGSLLVSVREFTFPDHPLVYVGRERNWEVLEPADESVSFEADPRLRMKTLDNPPGSLRFGANDNVPMTLATRAGEGEPILDTVESENFRLFSSWETYATIVDVMPDGTRLVEVMMILSPVPEDVKIHLKIFVGGILFDDGTLERWLLPEDFDELGQVIFRFIMPKEATSSVCHRTYVYQNDTLIGIR